MCEEKREEKEVRGEEGEGRSKDDAMSWEQPGQEQLGDSTLPLGDTQALDDDGPGSPAPQEPPPPQG